MAESRAYLERWIDEQGVDRGALARVLDGMDLSATREPSTERSVQRPEVLVPGLTASPWWDSASFPWLSDLEEAFPRILAEFTEVGGLSADNAVSHPNTGNLARSGTWSAYYFYLLGQEYSDHLAACPDTVTALSTLDGVRESGMCYFSIMSPGAHVAPHCGFVNTRLRCHLGLVVPEDGCRMRVADETRTWADGRAFVFDDSFEHEVWNDSGAGRAVLLFDVWHPELTEIEKRALAHMMTVWKTFLYRDN
ncbi:aspartyl/asparaginyl beta-hydroxylase domain-containing protein [Actinokineospora enzanensis]|uniref:aspartyl/asparaginyl beta-hydroxylase domain-containing protein n=1 Tax=Actinokineospora enzanensis TaxID=155975 RepID=UPI0003A699C9|nr:aspartyl/asparaginyl beta-hydroxylase domain-containing protein [Actinokineospora enzanensis]